MCANEGDGVVMKFKIKTDFSLLGDVLTAILSFPFSKPESPNIFSLTNF